MSTNHTTPKIYVACLAAYDNGKLHGCWIEANQEPEEIYQAIRAMLNASPEPDAEEWEIHDYEGFGSVQHVNQSGIEKIAELAAFIAEHEALGCAVLEYFDGEIEVAESSLTDDYAGSYDSLANYAQEFTEATIEIPTHLAYYIDYKAMAHDMELSGDVFTIKLDGQVHIFWSR
jgi:antirestriction protein